MSSPHKESLVSQYFGFKKKSRSKSQNNSSSSPSPPLSSSIRRTDDRTKPLIWSGKSQDDLQELILASPLHSSPIYSSISGPDGGLTRARALRKPLTLRHEDQFMFIDDEDDEVTTERYYKIKENKLDQLLSNNINSNNSHLCLKIPFVPESYSSSGQKNHEQNQHNKLQVESQSTSKLPSKKSYKYSSLQKQDNLTCESSVDTLYPLSSCTSLSRKALPLPPESLINSSNIIAGSSDWNFCSPDFAYGISESLYECHPITGARAGEPIADCYALSVRTNSAIIAIADGVNWGKGSAIAATCAIRGAMEYLDKAIYHGSNGTSGVTTTKEIAISLLRSMTAAHTLILSDENASQTTLTVGVTAQLAEYNNKWVLVTCNVGDSFAYVFSREHGVREVTQASHDIHVNRNMSDTCGALGPVIGNEPVLDNLTIAMTLVDEGDVIIFASDGISDNFDPVVGDRALAAGSATAQRYLQRLTSMQTSNDVSCIESNSTSRKKQQDSSLSTSTSSSSSSSSKNAKTQANLKQTQQQQQRSFNGNSNHKSKKNGDSLPPGNNESDKSYINYHIGENHQQQVSSNDGRKESRESSTMKSSIKKSLPIVPLVTAKERHEMTLERMEQVIRSTIKNNQGQVTAQSLAQALFNYANRLTVEKRSLIQRRDLYNLTDDGVDDFTHVCQKERRKKAGRTFWNAPGKLDHASIVTYKVGSRSKIIY